MKKLFALALLPLVAACAAPQPIPVCDWDYDQPRWKQSDECKQKGSANDDRSSFNNSVRDDRSSPDTVGGTVPDTVQGSPTGTRSGTDPRSNPPVTPDNPTGGDEPSDPPVNPPNGDDDKPKKDKKLKGNASANNGKGGNYSWTGHEDNGKGQGRNKK